MYWVLGTEYWVLGLMYLTKLGAEPRVVATDLRRLAHSVSVPVIHLGQQGDRVRDEPCVPLRRPYRVAEGARRCS